MILYTIHFPPGRLDNQRNAAVKPLAACFPSHAEGLLELEAGKMPTSLLTRDQHVQDWILDCKLPKLNADNDYTLP